MQTSGAGGADEPRPSLKGIRVLVVEDQWQVAQAMKQFLETEGGEVSGPVATVTEALQLAAKPDVAIVDINLRGEMAYDLIEQLHAQGVRIIVVSGYPMLPRVAEKAVAVLQKPFNGRALLAALRCIDTRRPDPGCSD